MTSHPVEANGWDWWLPPIASWRRLHAVSRCLLDPEDAEAVELLCAAPGLWLTAVCGYAGHMTMPGLVSRMGMPRCGHCCRALRIGGGPGTPANESALLVLDQRQVPGEDLLDGRAQMPGVPVMVSPSALGDLEGTAKDEPGEDAPLLHQIGRVPGGCEPRGDGKPFRIRPSGSSGDLGVHGVEGKAAHLVQPGLRVRPVRERELAGNCERLGVVLPERSGHYVGEGPVLSVGLGECWQPGVIGDTHVAQRCLPRRRLRHLKIIARAGTAIHPCHPVHSSTQLDVYLHLRIQYEVRKDGEREAS
jgi:hypothetical protein